MVDRGLGNCSWIPSRMRRQFLLGVALCMACGEIGEVRPDLETASAQSELARDLQTDPTVRTRDQSYSIHDFTHHNSPNTSFGICCPYSKPCACAQISRSRSPAGTGLAIAADCPAQTCIRW